MAGQADTAKQNIKHIVVLMMENRSFDHMLGFLSLPESHDGRARTDVEGIADPAQHTNPSPDLPTPVQLERLKDTAAVKVDTPHKKDEVAGQIQPDAASDADMSGFVEEYAKKLKDHGEDVNDASLVMRYYARPEVWALDQLIEQSVVCDHWFSSWAGPTHPNRMMALAGTSNDLNENKSPQSDRWDVNPVFEFLDPAKVEWRSYSHDLSFLRLIESYELESGHIDKVSRFYDRARRGSLPHVTWIDPNFACVPEWLEEAQQWFGWPDPIEELFGNREGSEVDLETDNSDHPDADIARGQELIARVYNRLIENDPKLEKTLFIVVYDEHGGFYDHVVPPGWPGHDPTHARQLGYPNGEHRFGVRVPAVVASGWLEQGGSCSHAIDHAAIIKTILEQFPCKEEGPQRPQHINTVPDVWTALEGNWRQEPPKDSDTRTPIRKMRTGDRRKNDLRRELGEAMQGALQKGTPTEKL